LANLARSIWFEVIQLEPGLDENIRRDLVIRWHYGACRFTTVEILSEDSDELPDGKMTGSAMCDWKPEMF
jgi:hypothetical protein